MSTTNKLALAENPGLVRSQAYNDELEVRFDDNNFMAHKYVEWLPDVEGSDTTLNIPGTGETTLVAYNEGDDITATGLTDTVFTFKADSAFAGAVTITREMLRSSYYVNKVIPFIAQDQTRQCYKILENAIFTVSQTLPTQVDGVQHRLLGSGAGNTLSTKDFSTAKKVIRKSANMTSQYIAFVDPDMASEIETSINITTQANSRFEPVAEDGLMDNTGTQFLWNIYGVDVYVTNFLADGVVHSGGDYDGQDHTDKKAVVVFSVEDPRKLPIIAAWVERPNFDFEDEPMKRQEHHICHMEFGVKLHHAVNYVTIECAAAA